MRSHLNSIALVLISISLLACDGSSKPSPGGPLDAGNLNDGGLGDASGDAAGLQDSTVDGAVDATVDGAVDAALTALTCDYDCTTRGRDCVDDNDGDNFGICECNSSAGTWLTPDPVGTFTVQPGTTRIVEQPVRFEHDNSIGWSLDLPNLGGPGSSVGFIWDYTWTYGNSEIQIRCNRGLLKTSASTCTGTKNRFGADPYLTVGSLTHSCTTLGFNDSGHIFLDFECEFPEDGVTAVLKTKFDIPHGTFQVKNPTHPFAGQPTRTPDSLCIDGRWAAYLSLTQ